MKNSNVFIERFEEFLAEILLKVIFVLFFTTPLWIGLACIAGLFISGVGG